jgi:hypothetical protein
MRQLPSPILRKKGGWGKARGAGCASDASTPLWRLHPDHSPFDSGSCHDLPDVFFLAFPSYIPSEHGANVMLFSD